MSKTVACLLLSPAEYARRRGCSREAVRCQIERDDPPAAGPDLPARPPVADSRTNGSAAPHPLAGAFGAPTAPDSGLPAADPSYANHRARREAADAERAELETARLAGRLVERDRVAAAVFDAFRALRDRVLAVPRRCASNVVGLVEVREIEIAMADELRLALGADEAEAQAALQAKVLGAP